MYFDIKPKTKREDLFGVDYALRSLIGYLSDNTTRMIVIKGLRRMGKTSLLNVALNESKVDSVKIDVRESPYYDKKEFLRFLVSKMKQKTGESLVHKIVKKISGFAVGYKDLSATILLSKGENLALFFDNFNKQLAKKKKKFILAFDEVQLLKQIGFDFVLASIFDNYSHIKLLLTGSEIGLLDKFLGKKIYKAPLFGRGYFEIGLKRIKEEEATRFLEEGFKQIKKKIGIEEIKEVIENFDGIIGWITHYGWLRSKAISHEKAIEKVKEEGKELSKRELGDFLKARRAKSKYMKILKYLTHGNNSWSMLKYSFEKEGIKVTDSQLSLYLKELIDYSFIEKANCKYAISDPMMLKAAREQD